MRHKDPVGKSTGIVTNNVALVQLWKLRIIKPQQKKKKIRHLQKLKNTLKKNENVKK